MFWIKKNQYQEYNVLKVLYLLPKEKEIKKPIALILLRLLEKIFKREKNKGTKAKQFSKFYSFIPFSDCDYGLEKGTEEEAKVVGKQ